MQNQNYPFFTSSVKETSNGIKTQYRHKVLKILKIAVCFIHIGNHHEYLIQTEYMQ